VAGFQSTFLNANGVSANETHIFAPNLVNEFRAGYARSNTHSYGSDYGHNAAAGLGIQNINISQFTSGIPNIHVQDFTGLGGGPDWLPAHPLDTDMQIEDGLSLVKGRHQLKFGFRGVKSHDAQTANEETRGDIYFYDNFTNNPSNPSITSGSGIATLLLGYSTGGQRGFIEEPFYMSANAYAAYLQDDWKVNKKLTLNLGVRYDVFRPPVEKWNRWANYDLDTFNMIYAGTPGVSRTGNLQTHYGNFAPRIGFAYDPTGSAKTVVRGGYAVVRFPLPESASSELGCQVPWLVSQSYSPDEYPLGPTMASIPTIADPFGPPVTVQPTTTAELNADNPAVLAEEFANWTPYWETYTFNVERQITRSTLFQIGYAGSRGIHLLDRYNINEVEPGPGSLASRRLIQPLSNVASIVYSYFGNMSNYNSLQAKMQRNMSHGLLFLVNYTWSKSFDYAGNAASGDGMVYSAQTFLDRKAGYGLSGFDLTHRVVGSYIYQLPLGPGRQFLNKGPLSQILGGWEYSGIATLQSGFPFSVSLATSVTNGATNSWPNQICSGKYSHPDPSAWYNMSCFVPPPINPTLGYGPYGNVSRTPLRGPATLNFDMALAKTFKLHERTTLAFRAEGFNIFNTPNFALFTNGDWGYIGLPDANAITGTFIDNREFQLSLKLTF
jgi:hypothetical protein